MAMSFDPSRRIHAHPIRSSPGSIPRIVKAEPLGLWIVDCGLSVDKQAQNYPKPKSA